MPPQSPKTAGDRGFFKSAARLLAPLVVLVLMAIFFAWITGGRYLQPNSLTDIGQQAAIIVIVGIGQTLVIIAGGIDLSVGAVVAFSGSLAAVLILEAGFHPMAAAAIAVLAGGAIGFFNGFTSVKTRVHPFIITLGSMMIFRGLALWLTGASNTDLLPETFTGLATGKFPLGPRSEIYVPNILIVYIVVLGVVTHLMLTRTRVGRYCFAIGSNPESARLSGVNVGRWTTLYFALAGLLFGFGGIVQAARVGIGQPTIAEGMELEAIAAAVIGGTSLAGGQGSVGGTIIGALLMAGLRQGLRMVGLQPYWQTVALGAAIVVAVIYDRVSRRSTT
ncbi:MAG: ABC transporter permease [Armatimonadota bacterium]